MTPFTTLTSRVVPLLINDIDTDQIIPARFLTGTTREGLGKFLFADLRAGADGSGGDFPLDRSEYAGARILMAGNNFGCGSSREHAAWALTDFGFRAVVSTAFADIFSTNALKNGLLPVQVDTGTYRSLQDDVRANPALELTINLERQELSWRSGSARFPIDSFARQCLLHGVDELGYILRFADAITEFETRTASRRDS